MRPAVAPRCGVGPSGASAGDGGELAVEELGESGLELDLVGEEAVELGQRCGLGGAAQGAQLPFGVVASGAAALERGMDMGCV